MNASAPSRRNALVSVITAIAVGIVLGVAGVFTTASVVGQGPQAEATSPVEVLDYGTR